MVTTNENIKTKSEALQFLSVAIEQWENCYAEQQLIFQGRTRSRRWHYITWLNVELEELLTASI